MPSSTPFDASLEERATYLQLYRCGYEEMLTVGQTTYCVFPIRPAAHAGWRDGQDAASPIRQARLESAIERRDRRALLRLFRGMSRDLREQLVDGILADV